MLGTSAFAVADTSVRTCPSLLMEFECEQYYQRIEQASSNTERQRIFNEYVRELNGRWKACRATKTPQQQTALLRKALPQFNSKN